MSIEIHGLDNIMNKLKDLSDVRTYERAVQQGTALVEGDAKRKAPKDTGALRNSIASKVETQNGEIVGTVYTPLEYAPYIEYGTGLFSVKGGRTNVPWNYKDDKGVWHRTSGMKPQPFMKPALDDNRNKITKLIKESIDDKLS